MRTRLSVSVTALAIAFTLAFAAPAQAVNGKVSKLEMVHRMFGGVVYLYVTFVLLTSLTPYQMPEVVEPTEDCSDNRPVKIQKKMSSGWKTVKSGKTNAKAKFKGKMKDRPGAYRVMVPEYMTPNVTQCFETLSKAKTHKH